MVAERLDAMSEIVKARDEKVQAWFATACDSLATDSSIPEPPVLAKTREEHHGAPLAIWLGIFLDGIPESLVIGASMLSILGAKLAISPDVGFVDVIPFTLIAGLFLSNFPEALSSSANMKQQGWKDGRIFLMWFSLMLIAGIGSAAGYLLADQLNPLWLVLFEGLAAGAMLTMIAAAMIPEAVLMGSGNTVGISTLTGFMAAICFKLLE